MRREGDLYNSEKNKSITLLNTDITTMNSNIKQLRSCYYEYYKSRK